MIKAKPLQSNCFRCKGDGVVLATIYISDNPRSVEARRTVVTCDQCRHDRPKKGAVERLYEKLKQ